MDKETRNHIQRATQAARGLLEEAYREQLEGTYDILLDGTISEKAGSHLSDRQKVIREKLVAAVAHKRSTGLKSKEAVDAYLREAAFTTLNRFVALKMLEARGLVQECVSKGEDSSGFKEFTALAPGLVAAADKGYRLYIETLFDEIGQEVKVLFDRHDVAGLLWPDRQTLLDLFDILNVPELAGVWAEDETIGWVYQYFNGDEERTKMRKESQAPRNSRELAVRNQFFTPRYVVEFLTDNTLGRTWYEMMQGETRFANLDYLVRRPNEVFLADGESAPESEGDSSELSQEELLQKTVHVPFREKKDPRDLRILDPACGSGHFLLYAFDLLIIIYEETWGDADAAPFTETGVQLRVDYGSVEEIRRAMPELIMRYNLHGVDIDPRAAQIAALALWMRAQRAYNQFEVRGAERPPITKTNIVVAEPMPGDAELVEEFAAGLEPPVIGDLFKKMVEEMELAGELGSLLKIEESIAETVATARRAFVEQQNQLSEGFLPGFEPAQGELDLSGIDDESFFEEAEATIIAALSRFTESAAGSAGIRRQLFVGDSVQGVAFIELMRNRFDVVLMNPPFGNASRRMLSSLRSHYPVAYVDLYTAFVERGLHLTTKGGRVGAITSSTLLKLSSFEAFRTRNLLSTGGLRLCVELGQGVLDSAMVETAAYTVGAGFQNRGECFFLDASTVRERGDFIQSSCSKSAVWVEKKHKDFLTLPKNVISYDLGTLEKDFRHYQPISGYFKVQRGSATGDDVRFIRAVWEVPQDTVGTGGSFRWRWLSKGGSYGGFYAPIHLVLDWLGEGGYLGDYMYLKRPRNGYLWGPRSWSREFIGKSGITWPLRSQRGLSFRVLPAGCAFSHKSPALISRGEWGDTTTDEYFAILALLNADRFEHLANSITTFGSYEMGTIGAIPIEWPHPLFERLRQLGASAYAYVGAIFSLLETDPNYQPMISATCTSGADCLETFRGELDLCFNELHDALTEINSLVPAGDESDRWADEKPNGKLQQARSVIDGLDSDALVSELFGLAIGRWDIEQIRSGETVAQRVKRLRGSAFEALKIRPCLSLEFENDPNMNVGILHDDPGAEQDLCLHVERVSAELLRAGPGIEPFSNGELATRRYFASSFFETHIKRYSASRRKAPVYWQLATPSTSYSVWCYYHRLNRNTFFQVANDYVAPKVDHEERKLNELRQEAGPDPSSKQRKAIDEQENFVAELRTFAAEVNRVVPLWNPNLNDGVIINFAPLWRLVPQHKAWQKECKACWDKLVQGDYDWAHLAMHLWPERVVPKCQDDRSLAIAHGLEDDFWYEDDDGKWKNRKVSNQRVEELIVDRSSSAVKAALQDLLKVPAPGGPTRRKRRTKE